MPASSPLPHRDGLDPCRQHLPAGPWLRLGDYLGERFPGVSASDWQARFAAGRAVDGRGGPLRWDQPYPAGAELHYYRERADEPRIPFAETILYQDDDLLVADKPHFLPVVPAGRFVRETLLARLRQRTGLAELTPLHRLDRLTAGLVLLSCRAASRGVYTALFRDQRIAKVYHALAPVGPPLAPGDDRAVTRRSRIERGVPFFRMAEVEGPANAETRIALIEGRDGEGLYRLEPRTGRKHQLRVHMAALGLAIRGDPLYPRVTSQPDVDDWDRPLQLLAQGLRFVDPLSGAPRQFESARRLG